MPTTKNTKTKNSIETKTKIKAKANTNANANADAVASKTPAVKKAKTLIAAESKVESKNDAKIETKIDSKSDEFKGMIRLSKLIADSGYCSRRKAEELIKQGLVSLNGEVVKSVAILAKIDDKIDFAKQVKEIASATSNTHFDKNKSKGKVKNNANSEDEAVGETKLYALYKPTGYIVTESEDEGKQNIYSLIPKSLGRLIYIGRLDVNSEGLLLLTNSGDFARKMSLPENKIVREYRVRAYGFFDEKKIKRMSKGVMIDGISHKPEKLELERAQINKIGVASNIWFKIWLSTGKNREIRKLFEHFNLQVSRLIRISYGSVSLQGLKHGEIMQINSHKVAKMKALFEK